MGHWQRASTPGWADPGAPAPCPPPPFFHPHTVPTSLSPSPPLVVLRMEPGAWEGARQLRPLSSTPSPSGFLNTHTRCASSARQMQPWTPGSPCWAPSSLLLMISAPEPRFLPRDLGRGQRWSGHCEQHMRSPQSAEASRNQCLHGDKEWLARHGGCGEGPAPGEGPGRRRKGVSGAEGSRAAGRHSASRPQMRTGRRTLGGRKAGGFRSAQASSHDRLPDGVGSTATLPRHVSKGSARAETPANTLTSRKARAGTEPSGLNGWHKPKACPAEGFCRGQMEAWQDGNVGQALF